MRLSNYVLAVAIACSPLSHSALCVAAPVLTVSIEVTQAAQTEENTVLLVAGRRTAVRTSVMLGDGAGPKASSIELAELTVTPASGGVPTKRTTDLEETNKQEFLKFLRRGDQYKRKDANHTLNFRISDLAKGKWKFSVRVRIKFEDGSTASGEGSASLKCVEVRPIHIYFVPMTYTGANGKTYGPPDVVRLKKAEHLLRACFPVPESAVIDWKDPESIPDTERTPTPHTCINGILDRRPVSEDESTDVDQALDELATMKMETLQALQPAVPHVYYFGWVDNKLEDGFVDSLIADGSDKCRPILGWSDTCGVGFGTAKNELAGKVFAHELGHMLQRDHFTMDCDGTGQRPCYLDKEVGWDVEAHQPRVKCHSFMISGNVHRKHGAGNDLEAITPDNVWVSVADYKHFIEVWRVDPSAPPPSTCHIQQDPLRPPPQLLLVEGRLSDDGKEISWLKPLFPFLWPARTTASVGSGEFELEATLSDGSSSRLTFDPRLRVEYVKVDESESQLQFGYFRVAVPIPMEAKTVEKVIIRRDGVELINLGRRPTPPALESHTLDLSKPLSEKTTLTWTPKADKEIRLRYHVVYSPDDGTTFERVGINLRKPEVVIDPTILTKSQEGKGVIRIYVSDGLNTVPVDIKKLTVKGK